ncbi:MULTISPECIES: glycoside hydrolase family 28 protein [unclassified Pseudomonas]|uniref:glycosyl hydrolase family 28 protein n=1 Tax=unclassified Pseudomonas TaxID=196821 RepID=UPI000A0CA1A1|nr:MULTISPECIES: glycoside hydrolase family 28 protein [unclassified Pseudomonas]SMF16781.1 exo-poly-alpha-galacturonosidase [Pseudomonas sp. LAIL14HWK12:I11]SMR77462.1 exo-poly-alpha-galacturonosidase [Pseudomonas sp. LAIL14HWK12:I10]SOD02725.1 exo-poly-alpha-galacturonosidase [Pseudomonas sp. LAIL14HWK12:I8]
MPHANTATTQSLLTVLALGFSSPLWALEAPSKVLVPTLAYDDQQIILVWEKPADPADIADYHVYANGKLLGGSNANNGHVSPAKPYIDRFYEQDTRNFHHRIAIHSYTAVGLAPDTEYRFTVRSVDHAGKESADSPVIVQRTTAVPALFDVRHYGAKGDGQTLDTAAIQKAIDACTVGCKVLLPAGTYKSGALYLKSNMTLEIAEGATLLGSERAEDYPRDGYIQYPYSTTVRPASLINALPRDPRAHQAFENIRIVGKGVIDGNGWKRNADIVDERGQPLPFYLPSDNTRYLQDGVLAKAQVARAVAEGMNVKDAYGQMRSSLVTLRNVKNVFYGGFTVLNPAYHGIMNLETENVVLANTTHKTYDANNGDGIEFANSRGALVFNNFFDTGDDCVNFAAGTGADAVKQKPQEDAWIFNNYFRKGHGMVVAGSHTGAWIQNILAEDNVSDGTDTGLRMKSTNFMGGGARNVVFRDSAMRNTVKQAFIFTLDYNDPNAKLDYKKSTIAGQFRDVRVSNVTVENAQLAAIEVKGDSLHGAYHQGLSFERVRFSGPAKAKIDGLKGSRFDTVHFSETGSANPWQVSASDGLVFEDVQPAPEAAHSL